MLIDTTREQREALLKLYRRDSSDHKSFLAFRRALMPSVPFGAYVAIWWCGMYVGIESDGHTHT